MILITYQDIDGTVRILCEYNDDQYEIARQDAEEYFTNGLQLVGMEMLLTEMDGDLSTSVCLDVWRPVKPHPLPKHPEPPSDGIMIARKISLWIAGFMIAGIILAVVRVILH
jgi:hypothetical protein